MKIAILICDTPAPSIVKENGDYFAIFTNLLKQVDSNITTQAFQVIQQEYPSDPSLFDCYLITGSKYTAYHQEEWILKLKEFVKTNWETFKWIGICFGHQIIAEALYFE